MMIKNLEKSYKIFGRRNKTIRLTHSNGNGVTRVIMKK
jgi:hypothetical protein